MGILYCYVYTINIIPLSEAKASLQVIENSQAVSKG